MDGQKEALRIALTTRHGKRKGTRITCLVTRIQETEGTVFYVVGCI